MQAMIQARLAAVDEPAERRGAQRQAVALDARLRALGTTGAEVQVLNLSATGFMAECDAEIAVGARVWLMLPGRERLNALVRWANGGRLGGEFADPIPLNPGAF